MHEVLVNRLGGLSLPRKSVVRLTDRPDMTLDVYRGRKTTMQMQLIRLQSDLSLSSLMKITCHDSFAYNSFFKVKFCRRYHNIMKVAEAMVGWLFSVPAYIGPSPREEDRKEQMSKKKKKKKKPPAPDASAIGPCPPIIQINRH